MAASGGDEPPAAAAPARSCSPTLGCSRAYDAGPLALPPGQKTHLDQKEQEQEQEQDDEAMAEAEEEQAPLATEVRSPQSSSLKGAPLTDSRFPAIAAPRVPARAQRRQVGLRVRLQVSRGC